MQKKNILIIVIVLISLAVGAFLFLNKKNNIKTLLEETPLSSSQENTLESKVAASIDPQVTQALKENVESFIQQKETKAGSADAEKQKQLRQFLENPLKIKEFEQLQASVREQLKLMESLPLPPEQKEAFLAEIRRMFDANTIYQSYMNDLYNNLSQEDLTQLNELYTNPLAVKSFEAEQAQQTLEGQQEAMEFIQTGLAANPLSDERKALLESYDKATGMSEQAVQMIEDSMGWMQEAQPKNANGANSAQQQQMLNMMKQQAEEQVRLGLAATNRNFTDDELRELTTLRGSSAAKKEADIRVESYKKLNSEVRNSPALKKILEQAGGMP